MSFSVGPINIFIYCLWLIMIIKIIPLKDYMLAPTAQNREDQFLLGFGGIGDDEIPTAIQKLMECWKIHYSTN